jgi:HlyD family secretion protein
MRDMFKTARSWLVHLSPRGRLTLAAGIVLVAAVGFTVFDTTANVEHTWVPLERTDLPLELIETGEVKSLNAGTIKAPRSRSQPQIIELAPEGSYVDEGDVVVRFDATELVEELENAQERLAQEQAELRSTQSEQANRIRNFEIDLKKADYTREAAEMRLEQLKFESEILKEEALLEHKKTILGIESTEKNRESQILKDKVQIQQANMRIHHAEQRVAHNEEMIDNYIGRAPRAGMVVYGTTGGWNSPKRKITESDQVHSGSVVIRIPDLSAMLVEVQINELDVARVRPGQKTVVTLDAFEDTTFTGSVESVNKIVEEKVESHRFRRGGSDRGSIREVPVFTVSILLDGSDSRIKPGLTAKARIRIGTVEDVLTVARAAIFENDAGEPVVFSKRTWPKPVPVTVTDKSVLTLAVTGDLREDDIFATIPPAESATHPLGWFAESERRRTEKASLLGHLGEMADMGITGDPPPEPEPGSEPDPSSNPMGRRPGNQNGGVMIIRGMD